MVKQITDIILKELENPEEMLMGLPLINQLYPKLTEVKYKKYLQQMIKQGYKMLVVYHKNRLVAVCGYYVSCMFYCGSYLQFCNLVVDESFRGLSIGTKIISYLEEKAKELDCDKIVLDSYTQNKRSHSLYYEKGFYVRGFHFMKDLKDF